MGLPPLRHGALGRVVDPADYQTYDWQDWLKLRPSDGELFIQAVRFRLRGPEVVTLKGYDELPTATVTFSLARSRSIIERGVRPMTFGIGLVKP